jgi:hypothetical protein
MSMARRYNLHNGHRLQQHADAQGDRPNTRLRWSFQLLPPLPSHRLHLLQGPYRPTGGAGAQDLYPILTNKTPTASPAPHAYHRPRYGSMSRYWF